MGNELATYIESAIPQTLTPAQDQHRIINCGLPKTGTCSLQGALAVLGYKVTHNHKEMIRRSYPIDPHAYVMPDGYHAHTNTCEWFFDKWCEHNPDLLFIITEREIEGWLASCHKQLKSEGFHDRPWEGHGINVWGVDHYSDEGFRDSWVRHRRKTRRYFAENDNALFIDICANPAQAWIDICKFLGHRAPDILFPHINRTLGLPVIRQA